MQINMKNNSAEIFLYEDIGGFFGITADSFVKEVKSMGKINDITLRINSNGGNVFDGLAIHNYLKSHEARVVVEVDGLAASIASIIAMAGDDIRMAGNAWMMIHDPWIVTGGTAEELRTTADTMDGVRDTLLNTYVARSGADKSVISDMMRKETWLNASEAREYGLADNVGEHLAIAASVHKEWFPNAPEELQNAVEVEAEEESAPDLDYVKGVLAKQNAVLRRYKL